MKWWGGVDVDHAIDDLIQRVNATIDMYKDDVSLEDLEPEIRAYVKAINALEDYLYGKTQTTLESVLY